MSAVAKLIVHLSSFEERLGQLMAPSAARVFTANQITIASGCISTLGALVLIGGTYVELVVGASLFYLGRWLDFLDGPVARHIGRVSDFGQTLDTIGTAISLVAFFSICGQLLGGLWVWIGAILALLALLVRLLHRVWRRPFPDGPSRLKRLCKKNPAALIAFDSFGCLPYWSLPVFVALDQLPLWLAGSLCTHLIWSGMFVVGIYRHHSRPGIRSDEVS